MLIKCPECGQDVSSEAENCIHCGYPIKANEKHMTLQDEINWLMEKVIPVDFQCPPPRLKVCAKCGLYIGPDTDYHHCRCGKDTKNVLYPSVEVDYPAAGIGNNLGVLLYVYEHCVKPRNIGDENAVAVELNTILESIQKMRAAGRYVIEVPPNPKWYGIIPTRETELTAMNELMSIEKSRQPFAITQDNPTPHCPSCGSENLSKITLAQKGLKVALLGFFGTGDNGKTWKCNNCGTKF